MSSVLSLNHIIKRYHQGAATLEVLRGVSLNIQEGEVVALVGPSGCGKSTLLQIAGLLDAPDEGEISIAGQECSGMKDASRTRMRRQHVGFIYQFHHLLPECSAIENVMMPLLLMGKGRQGAQECANALLEAVKLSERVSHRPSELSGGEQQRVAIARALVTSPSLILADEPTGNLDPDTSDHVFSMMMETIRSTNAGALIATHNLELAKRMDRIIRLDEINS